MKMKFTELMRFHTSKIVFLTISLFGILACSTHNTFYVATNGDDSNPGTITKPFASISKAHSMVVPGDIIYVRGGTYFLNTTLILSRSGTSEKRISLFAYSNENPVLDGSKIDKTKMAGRGAILLLKGAQYWHIKGFEICNGPWGVNLDKNSGDNIIELINTHHNRNPGFYTYGPNNLILNCDSHHNFDEATDGGGADGFATGYGNARNNILKGCRAWNNSDDGYDTWEGFNTVFENCWAFRNGYNDMGERWGPKGDGNGFKLGRGEGGHVVKKCISWNNMVNGFDYNAGEVLAVYNCIGWNNQSLNFRFTTKKHKIRNCVSFGEGDVHKVMGDEKYNSWNIGTVVKSSDFLSLDDSGVEGPRQPDGSLPDIDFMKLSINSQLVDKGIDIGLPYSGKAPDLGVEEK